MRTSVVLSCVVWLMVSGTLHAEVADLILQHGKVVTVDAKFRIAQAIAVKGERILAVGTDAEIEKFRGADTRVVDLGGQTVIPGLIDSHVHATGAAMYEFDHPVPEMETIADVLMYVKSRADVLEDGEWINISQVFVTRLRDQRFPTRYELDQVAPKNPVVFRTGPDAALNSLALELSGIGKDYQITDGGVGYLERDPQTNEPNGILRSCTRLVKSKSSGKSATHEERVAGLKTLFADYNRVGLTSVCDRSASDSGIAQYEDLLKQDALTCRVFLSYGVNAQKPIEEVEAAIRKAAEHPRHAYNNRIWLRGIKVFLDGGMLTGSAFMRKPWGVSDIYSIRDPDYLGLIYIEPDNLYRMAKVALENDLQFTAHSVGDGAIDRLIDAYERVNRDFEIREQRPCITHGNFMSAEAIARMQTLGIVADLQPAWLWLDGKTLLRQFGDERLRYFQPYRSLAAAGVIVGGGSDHMQKVGSLRSVNPYNPWLGMWTVLTRNTRWTEDQIHPEEAISREDALRLYTINNAYLTFEEREKGSLEAGKLADFVILKSDLLTCPLEDVPSIEVEATYLGGKRVYPAE